MVNAECRLSWVRLELPKKRVIIEPGGVLASLSNFSSKGGDVPKLVLESWGTKGRAEMSLMQRVGFSALAGGIAGGFTNVVLHPIDTVKTKLQTRGSASMYSGPVDVIIKVFTNQGISGFYCGVQAALVGSVMSSATYFGTYELAKCICSNVISIPRTFTPPLAAALGNVVSSAILVPKEVIKQRMQAGAVGSARDVFLHTVQSEGIKGLYAGYSAALLRNLPSNMISFSAFEYLKFTWLNMSNASVLTPWQSVVSGALAGALSAAVTTPLDVAKTRLMTQARCAIMSTGVTGLRAEALARSQAIAAYTYKGVFSTLQQISREEGAHALLKGMAPRIFYSACFSALGFSVFESTRTFFLIRHLEQKKRLEELK
ncbi:hypothetical protein KP509_15G016300 [Ceratopteris richardii]|uniref:Mitochondrial carrier protein n=1 Tax=Ceratopteris richardii TaxID=49495 RepID=A0A8T2T271_CERRI|nr:hypothetical protein KP509_15G016300 [Ceratopteris richardii]